MTIDGVEMISIAPHEFRANERSSSSPLFLIFQRPLGVGFIVGLLIGFSNSFILGLPLLLSTISGITIGVLVCLFGCPAMKNQLLERRELEKSRKVTLARRARIISAFTSLD